MPPVNDSVNCDINLTKVTFFHTKFRLRSYKRSVVNFNVFRIYSVSRCRWLLYTELQSGQQVGDIWLYIEALWAFSTLVFGETKLNFMPAGHITSLPAGGRRKKAKNTKKAEIKRKIIIFERGIKSEKLHTRNVHCIYGYPESFSFFNYTI